MKLQLLAFLICTAAFADDLKIGVIGMDTSHVAAFTKLLNDTTAPDHVPGGKVVAAFKSGSADIPSRTGRVEEYSAIMQRDFGAKCALIERQPCLAPWPR